MSYAELGLQSPCFFFFVTPSSFSSGFRHKPLCWQGQLDWVSPKQYYLARCRRACWASHVSLRHHLFGMLNFRWYLKGGRKMITGYRDRVSGRKAKGKSTQDRSTNTLGQRVGLFQGWEAGVWALGFPQAPGSAHSPSWRSLCGRWAHGMDQINKKVGPWASRHDHRYPRLGRHRCWTKSSSYLEWCFLPGWLWGESRQGQKGWMVLPRYQRCAVWMCRAPWYWVHGVGGSGVGAAAAASGGNTLLLGWLGLRGESAQLCSILRSNWQLGLVKEHTSTSWLLRIIREFLCTGLPKGWGHGVIRPPPGVENRVITSIIHLWPFPIRPLV